MKQPHEILEQKWAAFNDLDPAGMVACSSGTAALHLALEALRLPPGSEVITGDFNMIAVPRAIAMAGLMPVFVDCRDDLLMDADLVSAAVFDARTVEDPGYPSGKVPAIRGIIDTAVYGRVGDDDRLMKVTDMPIGTFVIQDLAEAHGVRPHEGTDAACWSFQRTKHVHGEEGGAVWFRDPAHARAARELRSMGFGPTQDYVHRPRAHNYRLANLLAAPILRSLDLYQNDLAARWAVYDAYDRLCPPAWRMPRPDAPWVYSLRVPGLTRVRMTEAVKLLNFKGVAARHGFWPMRRQEEFARCRAVRAFGKGGWESDRTAEEVFLLPLAPSRVQAENPDRWAEQTFRLLSEALPPP